jgi:alpha-glucosidase
VTHSLKWWQTGVIYQIYPRSFMDANGDGVGDLQGIMDRVDYLAGLGIDAVWISPIYPSPMADFGYDVANYTDIHPLFGDMATFDRLLDALHARGLKLILDYVPNHSSDQHPWFLESRTSRDNPRRDWYIWRDAKPDGSPPNNWESYFGGSAWEWDETTGQYYLHLFLKEQPDLNWRNPDVRAAMHDVLRFWLDRGVDGFRMDVVPFLMKHPDLPDNPPLVKDGFDWDTDNKLAHKYDANQPEIHDRFREFNRLFAEYDGDRVIIGETPAMDPAVLASFYGENLDELHMPFNFTIQHRPWDQRLMRDAIAAYYAALPEGATPNFVLSSHDVHRLATKLGVANHRSAGLMLLTLRGVPTLYYGDEIGMTDVDVPRDKWQDPWAKNMPDIDVGRDPERTPMQWDASPNAGFCPADVEPWLPVGDNLDTVSVAAQQDDPASTLGFYKQLLQLRRDLPALHRGDFAFIEGTPDTVMAYTRAADGDRLLVVINFGAAPLTVDVSAAGTGESVLMSTHFTAMAAVDLAALPLKANESLLIRLA